MNQTSTMSASGHDLTPIRGADRDRLAAELSDEERHILLDHGTERPFCGTLLNNKSDGLYACRLCGLPLFRSASKFESGTGWPSFTETADPGHVRHIEDSSLGMARTEIRCGRCDAHLGHFFPDGPPPSGQRYCLNSAAMEFYQSEADIPDRIAAVRSAQIG